MLIKISRKINHWMATLTIIQIVFFTVSLILNFGHVVLSQTIYFILSMVTEFIYILLLLYMIDVLIFLGEKKFIVVAFILYMCSDILRAIRPISMASVSGVTFGAILGWLTFVLTIYLFIATLKIKTRYVIFPYKLFSYVLLILTLLKLIITIILPLIADVSTMKYNGLILLRSIMYYIDVVSMLKLIAILFIVKGMNKFIRGQNVQNNAFILD